MSKKMNNGASEKSGAQGNGMEAKRDPESTQADVRQSAFEGVGDERQLLHATSTAQSSGSYEAGSQDPDSDEGTDLADRQRRDVKACASPSLEEVKDRIIAARRHGPSRPLEHLAKAETDLHARSAALTKLSSSQQRPPDRDLLVHQLTRTVNTSRVPKTHSTPTEG